MLGIRYWSVIVRGCRAIALIVAVLGGGPAFAQTQGILVTLLGTGSPDITEGRRGYSNLVQAGGLNLVFDAGRGMTMSLGELGIQPAVIHATFITHYHSDHVNGLADLFMMRYLSSPSVTGEEGPFELYGPAGIEDLANAIALAHRRDAEMRVAEANGISLPATTINAHTVTDGVVFSQNGVTVTMFTVPHGTNITPAVGYRVDYAGDSVVFTGDTSYSDAVIAQSTGVDLLVHDVALTKGVIGPDGQTILSHHTSPEGAARVFIRARPGLAVYSHIIRLTGAMGKPSLTDLTNRTRNAGYSGPLVLGEDTMQIQILGTSVTVVRDPP